MYYYSSLFNRYFDSTTTHIICNAKLLVILNSEEKCCKMYKVTKLGVLLLPCRKC